MPTSRENIRSAVMAALTGLATTGGNVFAPRLHRPLAEAELPALVVWVDEEQFRGQEKSWPQLQERRPAVVVLAVVRQSGDYDATIETIWGEVEAALAGDGTLGGACKLITDFALGPKEVDANGEQPALKQALSFTALYFARFGTPGTQA
jgi:hypothetical protein